MGDLTGDPYPYRYRYGVNLYLSVDIGKPIRLFFYGGYAYRIIITRGYHYHLYFLPVLIRKRS
jgi:hypothetical protein